MSRTTTVLVLIALCLVWVAPNAGAYPRYHPADSTNDITAFGICEGTTDACQIDADCSGVSCVDVNRGCYQCHGWDDDANPVAGTDTASPFRNDGFNGRGPLHDLHVTQITGTCDLCHQQPTRAAISALSSRDAAAATVLHPFRFRLTISSGGPACARTMRTRRYHPILTAISAQTATPAIPLRSRKTRCLCTTNGLTSMRLTRVLQTGTKTLARRALRAPRTVSASTTTAT